MGGQGIVVVVVAAAAAARKKQQVGRRLMIPMATLSSPAGSSMEIVRLQKTPLRTIVRRELRKFSPEVRVQEG